MKLTGKTYQMKKAEVKNITLDDKKENIIVTIDAKGSQFIEPVKKGQHGFPYLVSSAAIVDGLNFILQHDFEAVRLLQKKFAGGSGRSGNAEIVARVKQFLSALEYEKFTDFQAKCALLLEQSIRDSV